ncbi:AcrR family transcriptional regulator [Microbacterium sp. BE35]|uniref:TetR/AcrR family transcriptional regulator n=1 Tax=Microbacterium sp. BE35 TaxID=2817773 RepID=UPI0028592CF1|nr:helix-turn-helix domain-containing protein [Microbacterium sp. BE35]MDR7188440.1 AcrR family transcriptional regulator [Microbacterium sp. BE35]
MSTPPPPRRRDAVAKTAAIERAAIDLVIEHGYDSVTVDMICARAHVSQRTFFNHFRTKDAAVIGAGPPSIDERAAREFIVSSGPLLIGAAELIRIDPGAMAADPELLARRIRAVGTSSALMARQMERLAGLEQELAEIILLRLRTQFPSEDASHLAVQAELTTHILAGVMRYIGQSWAKQVEAGDAPQIDPSAIGEVLSATLAKLG